MSVAIQQSAEYQGADWWKWSVWIEGPSAELEAIEAVTYTLHPTFPEPVQVIKDARTKFRLDAAAWGEFEIMGAVQTKDGAVSHLRHWLVLRYPAGSGGRRASPKQPVIFLSSSVADVILADAIQTGLESRGMRVVTTNDAHLGLPIEEALQNLAQEANASIVLVSDTSGPWIEREINLMRQHDVAVIPVLIGQAPVKLPALQGIQALRLSDERDIAGLIPRLVDEINSRAIWE